MPRAIWNGALLADSANCEVVEGNYYFPPDSINRQHLRESQMHTTCSWKGIASYYDIVVDEKVNHDAAWYYPTPMKAAERIKEYVAFWKGVKVEP